MARNTGLVDRNNVQIKEGDYVSLDGNSTMENGLACYTFGVDDVYRVYFDERINTWSLDMGVRPDTHINRHYMNHALSVLREGMTTIVRLQ